MNEVPATSVVTKWSLLRLVHHFGSHRRYRQRPDVIAGRAIRLCLGNVEVAHRLSLAMYHTKLVETELAKEAAEVFGMGAHLPNAPEIQEILKTASDFPRRLQQDDPEGIPITVGYLLGAALLPSLDDPDDPEVHAGSLIHQLGSWGAIRWAADRRSWNARPKHRLGWPSYGEPALLDEAALLIAVAHCRE